MSWTAGRSATVIGRMRRTGTRTLTPCPRSARRRRRRGCSRTPARERHVLRHEAGEVVGVAGREAGGRRRPAGPPRGRRGRRRRGRPRRRGARPARSTATSRSPSRSSGSVPAGQDDRPPRPPASGRGRTGRRAASSAAGRRPPDAPAAAQERASRSRRRRSAGASAWARPFAVAIPTRRPVKAPGPGPHDEAAQVGERDAPVPQQRLDPRQQLLAVAVAGRPGARLDQRRRPAVARAMTARVVAVSMARIGPPAVTRPPRGTARTPGRRSAARSAAGRRPSRR